jgi:hypothetical protein
MNQNNLGWPLFPGREAYKSRIPDKMTIPFLPTRIVQHDDAAADDVSPAQIARFGRIAFKA